MTEMVLVHKKASSSSFSRVHLDRNIISAKSAEFVERSKTKTDSLNNIYRYNPFTRSIVEIDLSQAWFWTPEWLGGELEVQEEITSGEIEIFDKIEDIFDF